MSARDIHYALTHAWSKQEGMMEVESVYTLADCESWLKQKHGALPTMEEVRSLVKVPNALIRHRYIAAVKESSHHETREASEYSQGYESDIAAINQNVGEAYHRITGKSPTRHNIAEKIRVSLGISPKDGKTAIFMEREFAEAIISALSIPPHEVGV